MSCAGPIMGGVVALLAVLFVFSKMFRIWKEYLGIRQIASKVSESISKSSSESSTESNADSNSESSAVSGSTTDSRSTKK